MLRDSPVDMGEKHGASGSSLRFGFGENWKRFLMHLDEERIAEAERSICNMLEVSDLAGKSFLDVGCGSGLFSLAAMRKGAERIHSFDSDPQSVACAQELKRRYFSEAYNWTIQQGNVLDESYLSNLGQFDVVYCWGVLHHTGNMWSGLHNIAPVVAANGKLFIAIYNDQDTQSHLWKAIKERYNRGTAWRLTIAAVFGSYFIGRGLIKDTLILRKNPLARYRQYKHSRGMAYWTDLRDWLGGYPFEVARAEAIFDFFKAKGYQLAKLRTAGVGHGNNEFVFVKCAA
jgi:2-polyprenyl-6-hydroxyphenyl methylase/3-demethylubiquinone-9 3-methyltransferase